MKRKRAKYSSRGRSKTSQNDRPWWPWLSLRPHPILMTILTPAQPHPVQSATMWAQETHEADTKWAAETQVGRRVPSHGRGRPHGVLEEEPGCPGRAGTVPGRHCCVQVRSVWEQPEPVSPRESIPGAAAPCSTPGTLPRPRETVTKICPFKRQ